MRKSEDISDQTRQPKVSVFVCIGYSSHNKNKKVQSNEDRLTLELANGQRIPIVNRPSKGPPMTPDILMAACVKEHKSLSCRLHSDNKA